MGVNADTITMMTEAQLREPKSTVGIFDLPCGYVDAAGTLHTEVQLKEISGRDEDMLNNEGMPPSKKMNALLASCVLRIGTITDKGTISSVVADLLVGDRVFLILAIRRVSLGDNYPYKDTCPECERESLMSLNLGELEVQKMKDPLKRVFDARMPSRAAIKQWASTGEDIPEPEKSAPSGKTIRFKMLTGRDEEKIAKANKSKGEDSVSALLGLRILMLDDKPPTIEELQDLTMAERSYIRDVVFRRDDGGVDTTLEVTCPTCDHDFKRELDIGQMGFFFPSAARKSLKTKSST